MININDILLMNDSKDTYRVLWLDSDHDSIYLFNIIDEAMPIEMRLSDIEQQCADEVIMLSQNDEYLKIISETDISEKDKMLRNSIWKVVEPLISQEPDIYVRNLRGTLVLEQSKVATVPQKTIYRYLKKYWKHGKVKNAFLPNYQNCGGKGKERTSHGKKNGRQRQYGDAIGKIIDNTTKQIFEKVIKKYYHTRQEHTLTAAYERMIKDFYTTPVTQPDGTIRHELIGENEIPTIRQFRYWYSKNYDAKEKLISRKGQSQYNLNHRAILGKSDTNIMGPGAQYQIDATLGDIYLVSRFNNAEIIGRPVIYFVIDVFSRMIAGMYVGLEGPSWIGSMMALANAAANKVAYCKK